MDVLAETGSLIPCKFSQKRFIGQILFLLHSALGLFIICVFYNTFFAIGNVALVVSNMEYFINKPAAQAAGADLSRCNTTNRKNPPLH